MFFFGDPADIADSFLDASYRAKGPYLERVEDYSGLEREEKRFHLTYMRGAIKSAEMAEADTEVVRVLVDKFDSLMEELLREDEVFLVNVLGGKFTPPQEFNAFLADKYYRMALLAQKASAN